MLAWLAGFAGAELAATGPPARGSPWCRRRCSTSARWCWSGRTRTWRIWQPLAFAGAGGGRPRRRQRQLRARAGCPTSAPASGPALRLRTATGSAAGLAAVLAVVVVVAPLVAGVVGRHADRSAPLRAAAQPRCARPEPADPALRLGGQPRAAAVRRRRHPGRPKPSPTPSRRRRPRPRAWTRSRRAAAPAAGRRGRRRRLRHPAAAGDPARLGRRDLAHGRRLPQRRPGAAGRCRRRRGDGPASPNAAPPLTIEERITVASWRAGCCPRSRRPRGSTGSASPTTSPPAPCCNPQPAGARRHVHGDLGQPQHRPEPAAGGRRARRARRWPATSPSARRCRPT